MSEFTTKDSGKRVDYDSGMRRDTDEGKPRYDLLDRPMLKRWAELMARGAEKYGEENWRKANSDAEARRFQASAMRHMMQWLEGDRDEDHAAAVLFNIAAYEYVAGRRGPKYIVGLPADLSAVEWQIVADWKLNGWDDATIVECIELRREAGRTEWALDKSNHD